jgi:hypothetical protein
MQARFSFLHLSNRLSISKTAICAFYAQVNSGETFSKVLATLPRCWRRAVIMLNGGAMGDKGGKKDKEKNKQQQLTKQKQEEHKKHDKAPAKKSVAGSA